MPLYRAQVAVAADTTFPADRIVNTLHFDDKGLGTDPQGLAEDLVELWGLNWNTGVREIRATLYEVGPPPQYPVAMHLINEGLAPATSSNRETAVALSYYNERSNPRKRGRTFLCAALSGQSVGQARPSSAVITRASGLASALSGLGGADVDWVVYSPTNQAHYPVQGAWVDDAWDTIRSRGLRPQIRTDIAVGA